MYSSEYFTGQYFTELLRGSAGLLVSLEEGSLTFITENILITEEITVGAGEILLVGKSISVGGEALGKRIARMLNLNFKLWD